MIIIEHFNRIKFGYFVMPQFIIVLVILLGLYRGRLILTSELQRTLTLKQGVPYNLTCNAIYKHPEYISNLKLGIFDSRNDLVECFAACKFMAERIQCKTLLGSSNISCAGGANCYEQNECNFIFQSPSIALDGLIVACLDICENVVNWTIKGNV